MLHQFVHLFSDMQTAQEGLACEFVCANGAYWSSKRGALSWSVGAGSS